ncbi:MAG TPA: hypothetical protein VL360_05105 [Gammaproteobacteria bacterium]|nr:hypothetical protein [Gammaproteobacteria bacterium]
MQRDNFDKGNSKESENSKEKLFGIFKPIDKKDIPVKDIILNRGKLGGLQNAPTFYKASALQSLLDVATRSGIRQDRERVVRFLLSTKNNLIFAKEGSPLKDIPAHFQMANFDVDQAKCLTAGNAYFNDNGELCRIDHKSGDFRPPFDTLQFVFPALIQSGIPIAKELEIDKLNDKGGFEKRFKIDSSLISQLKITNQEEMETVRKLSSSSSTSKLFEKFGTDFATYDPSAAFRNSQEAQNYKPAEKNGLMIVKSKKSMSRELKN